MPISARSSPATLLLIRCCIALAHVGPANAQIISEIEVPHAGEKTVRKPRKAPRPIAPKGVTPIEVLSGPTQLSPPAGPAAPRKAKPRRGETPSEAAKPSDQVVANENLSLPNIDANRWCARISERVATANCVQFEEKQREFARIFWEDLSADGRRHCAGNLARLGDEAATNQSLAACVRTRLAQEERDRSAEASSVPQR